MRKILLVLSGLALGAVAAVAQVTGITVETFYTDDGMVTGYPAGHTTYRIYANCTNPTDVVASVFGNDDSPLSLVVDGGIWNSTGSVVNGGALNCSLFGFIPQLQYDSYVTLGRTCSSDPGGQIYLVEDNAQLWQDELFTTAPYGNTSMILNTTIGGAWFGLPGDANCFAGDDLKVLIGQITTNGSICGNFNIQVFPEWTAPGDPYILQTGLSFGTGDCGTPGCTDPDALNYDMNAGFDNGLCIYPCGVEFTEVTVVQPTCAGDNNGSIYFAGTGAQDFVQYTFQNIDGGFTPDTYDGLGNGSYTISVHDTRFDSELFNPGGIYGTCTVTQTIELNTPAIVFGTTAVTNVSCGGANDGCGTSTVEGGTGMLSVELWQGNNPVLDGDGNPVSLETPEYCGLGGGTFHWVATDESGCTVSSANFTVVSPPTLNLFIGSSADASCFNSEDGIQVVTWSGGTGDVDWSLEDDGVYDIEGGASNVVLNNLLPGDYTIYGADTQGCMASATFTIDGPDPITIEVTPTLPSCVGDGDGGLVAVAAGGDGSFTYSNDGINYDANDTWTGLSAGVYTIYALDGSGCATMVEFTLEDPAALEATAEVTDISCAGETDGSYTIVATGGTGVYTYSNDGVNYSDNATFSGLAAGDYDMYVMDSNGCSTFVFAGASVIEPNAITLDLEGMDVTCNGDDNGMIMATGVGGTGEYSYSDGGPFSSNDTFDNLGGGEYTITVVDENGCEASASITIVEPDALEITGLTADPIDEDAGGNSDYTVSGGTGGYSYEWTDADGNVVSTDMDLDALTDPADAGSYTLTITDENGCTVSQEILITGISELNSAFAVNVSPNPTLGLFAMNFSGLNGEKVSFRILDTQGRQVMNREFSNATGERREVVDLSQVAAGVYYIQLNVGDAISTIKLIKE